MSAISWLVFAALALAALVLIGLLYRTRETPGRGRGILAALRWAAVALVLLLLFDPELPTAALIRGSRARQVIADASFSMTLPDRPGGGTRWSRQAEAARRAAGGRDVLLFGDDVRAVNPDSLPAEAPGGRTSRLLPALQAASEAGVRQVTVLTDGAIDDAAQVSRWLPRLGIDIDYRVLGEPVRNAAVAEIEAPAWAQAGEPLDVRFGVTGVDMGGDTADVYLLQGRDTLAAERVVIPEQGRVAAGTLRFTPASPTAEGDSAGLVRYDVRLASADVAPDDDGRSVYVHVSDDPAGIVLLSFRPDWEPRFLQPVLAQALGIPTRGYLRASEDEYVALGRGLDAGTRVPEEDVRRAASAADLLVVQGAGADAPDWLGETTGAARRLIVLPADGLAGLGLPVEIGNATPGEWYVDPDVPSTPVAPLLAGLDVSDAPPLTALRFAEAPAGAWAPMLASRDRRGVPTPLALAGESEGGQRWAVALGDGYWRWMFRDGASRDIYVRLWGSLAGWIMREQGAIAAAVVRPAPNVFARGAPVRWVAPGLHADSLRVQLTDSAGTTVGDTVVAAQRDTALTSPLPPGHYSYRVQARAGGGSAGEAEGEITVESYSPEFTRPTVTLESLVRNDVPVGPDARRAPARPLHASAWPYALILLLIALEWALRRRWGLR